jgi:hypothetical protein
MIYYHLIIIIFHYSIENSILITNLILKFISLDELSLYVRFDYILKFIVYFHFFIDFHEYFIPIYLINPFKYIIQYLPYFLTKVVTIFHSINQFQSIFT